MTNLEYYAKELLLDLWEYARTNSSKLWKLLPSEIRNTTSTNSQSKKLIQWLTSDYIPPKRTATIEWKFPSLNQYPKKDEVVLNQDSIQVVYNTFNYRWYSFATDANNIAEELEVTSWVPLLTDPCERK